MSTTGGTPPSTEHHTGVGVPASPELERLAGQLDELSGELPGLTPEIAALAQKLRDQIERNGWLNQSTPRDAED